MMNDKCSQVGLILLAAGESRRMGTPKQLLSYQGQSLIRRAVTEAVESNCGPIIVVLGANRDRISSEINDLPVHIVQNAQWQQGMSASISTGIKALLNISSIDAVVIALADQPFVTAQAYDRLVERYCQNQLKVTASNYSDTVGVPALFDRSLLPELLKMNHQGGAKELLKGIIKSI